MAYCTIAELTERYGQEMLIQLSDRADAPLDPEAIDTGLFDRVIADADALIDGYLLGRYALPLAAVPRLLTDVSQRVTIYYAHGNVAPEKIRKDYEDALKTLIAIAKGDIRLNIDGAEPESSGVQGEVRTNDPARPLTADSMKGYI